MSANNAPRYVPVGPLTKVYGDAKRDIADLIDTQENHVAVNRLQLLHDFAIPNKLLAVRRSRANLILEITPLVARSSTGAFGKKSPTKE